MREETHIFLRHVEIYHVGSAVVGYLTQEHRQFRHFDVGTETLFALHCPRHAQLVVGCLLGEYRRPSVEAADTLASEFLRT